MPKAKTIDRLELTKRSSAYLRNRDKNKEPQPPIISDIPPDIDIHTLGDVCPMCGKSALIHESGCVKCLACSWSKCG